MNVLYLQKVGIIYEQFIIQILRILILFKFILIAQSFKLLKVNKNNKKNNQLLKILIQLSIHIRRFFLEDDTCLEEIRVQYGKGVIMTNEIKQELINVLTKIVTEHQQRRALVTDEIVEKFMELRSLSNYPPKKNN